MIINKVFITNFKKHRALEVNFTKGSNLISGSNYSGKSTVVQAVLVGLLGNSVAPGQTNVLVNDDAKDFKIVLTMDDGIVIERTSKNSTVTSAEGVIVVRTHTSVNKWVEDYLGVDRKTFMKVFISEQGTPQALLDMEGAQLQKFIEAALGMDKLDKAVRVVNLKVVKYKANFEANNDLSLPVAKVAEMQKQERHLNALWVESAQRLEQSAATKVALDQVIRKHTAEYRRQAAIQEEQKSYLANKVIIQDLLKDMPEERPLRCTEDLTHSLIRDSKVLEQQGELSRALNKEQKYSQEAKEYLNTKITELEGISVPAACDSLKERAHKAEMTERVSALGKEERTLRDLKESSVCPTCHRALSLHDRQEELSDNLLAKTEEAKEAVCQRVRAASSLAEAEKNEQDYLLRQASYSKVKAVVEDLTLHVDKADKALYACEHPSDEYLSGVLKDTVLNTTKRLKTVSEDNSKISHDNKHRERTEEKLASLVSPSKEIVDPEEEQKAIDQLKLELTALNKVMGDDRVCIAESSVRCSALQEALQANEKVKVKAELFRKDTKDFTAIAAALVSARKTVLTEGFTQILSIASEFVKACTGGDISQVLLTDCGITYQEGDRMRGTISASGAQKTLIGLGLKIGLSQIVNSPFGCLLLDEISADMDDTVSLACLTVLKDYCEQAIIVSHMPRDVADNSIEL